MTDKVTNMDVLQAELLETFNSVTSSIKGDVFLGEFIELASAQAKVVNSLVAIQTLKDRRAGLY